MLKILTKSVGVSRALALALSAMLLVSCAGKPADGTNDPMESFNREVFDFNMTLDRAILRPITRAYVDAVPDPIRDMLHNFLFHIKEPVTLANDLLQGEWDRAGQTSARIVLNTIVGSRNVGRYDSSGAEGHKEDFGQTLAVWGVFDGPYLVLPLLGPSNTRDTAAEVAQFIYPFLDPAPHAMDAHLDASTRFTVNGTRIALTAIDKRAQVLGKLAELEKTSLDFYAYHQKSL